MYNLYTIGYSGYNTDNFINLLLKHNINAIVDVRSLPFSKAFPDFNKDKISILLKRNKIFYVSMAEQLGARPIDKTVYTNDRVDFSKVSKSSQFLEGCARIEKGLLDYTICLMCSEQDPIICHRAILISHNINKMYSKVNIFHIIQSKIETHKEMEERLLYATDCCQFYLGGDDPIEQAYKKQSKKIAYKIHETYIDG